MSETTIEPVTVQPAGKPTGQAEVKTAGITAVYQKDKEVHLLYASGEHLTLTFSSVARAKAICDGDSWVSTDNTVYWVGNLVSLTRTFDK